MASNNTRCFSIANPAILVNGVSVAHVPNSVNITRGFGDVKTVTSSYGGGGIQIVVGRDVSNAIGKISWKVYAEDFIMEIIYAAQTNYGNNQIQVVNQLDVSYFATLSFASLKSDPNTLLSADGETELMFEGASLVTPFG